METKLHPLIYNQIYKIFFGYGPIISKISTDYDYNYNMIRDKEKFVNNDDDFIILIDYKTNDYPVFFSFKEEKLFEIVQNSFNNQEKIKIFCMKTGKMLVPVITGLKLEEEKI